MNKDLQHESNMQLNKHNYKLNQHQYNNHHHYLSILIHHHMKHAFLRVGVVNNLSLISESVT
jgi:hypothetical protein